MKKLGFGMMRLPQGEYQQYDGIDIEQVKEMVDDFIGKGFVYFDTAYPYHNGMSELVFAETVAKRYSRDKYVLADKLPIFRIDNREQAPKYFAEQLQKCGVEYFDYYLLHAMNASRCVTCEDNGIFDFVVEQKRLNKIKHLGFSFHDSSKVLDDILTRHPEIEFVQLQINYIDWHDNNVDSKACYEVACKHNKSIIVMEPVKGGSLVNLPTSAKQLLTTHSDMSVASWAVRYCASLDNCFMVLSGMSDILQMRDNISYMNDFVPLNPNEREVIEQVVNIVSQCATIPCTNCRYCIADCPRQIDIPRMFALYNKQSRFPDTDIAELVSQYYSIIGNTASAKSCIGCKQCEQLCPQHIDITRWLQIIASQFEK